MTGQSCRGKEQKRDLFRYPRGRTPEGFENNGTCIVTKNGCWIPGLWWCYIAKMKTILLFLTFLTALPLRAEMRTFKNTKGEEIKAEIVSASMDRAELKREDGKKFSVALATLSEEDRKWIAAWAKAHPHFKVQMAAMVKKGVTRETEGDAFVKKSKGNDCWYQLDFKNTAAEPLKGMRVEYIIFAPPDAAVPSVCGAVDVAAIPGGKSGQALTQKLFVQQATETAAVRSSSTGGSVTMSRNVESTLAAIRAEIFIDGKRTGTFLSGKLPTDAEQQLLAWREKQTAAKPDKPQP